jgi:hypothetical protein
MFKEFALVLALFVAGCLAGLVYDLNFEEPAPPQSVTALNAAIAR